MAGKGGVTRRPGTVEAVVGTLTAPDGRISLPAVELDTYFTMRQIPVELRAGFRAWIREKERGSQRHPLSQWDKLRGEYAAAPMK